ncbi:hypothetical protein B0H10DRAFT_2242734 [Mycena sp. CBHHK59/15]|nr:hypothetical protein B0H10DRAFT_2242734 [Mycena sp. CBHHK59/15]
MDQHYKLLRADEEIQRLNIEIQRLVTHMRDEEAFLAGIPHLRPILPARSAALGSDPATRSPKDLLNQVLHMDVVGAVFVAAAVMCLVLALQWRGNEGKRA